MNVYVWLLLASVAALITGCALIDLIVEAADRTVEHHVNRALPDDTTDRHHAYEETP